MPPISVLIKPASGLCNMQCEYCFYSDEMKKRQVPSRGIMSVETMKRLVDLALAFADSYCAFAFQGGEPSLAGLEFFQIFTDYVNRHPKAEDLQIEYSFQTNGYDLDETWMEWFQKYHVLVGVSLDGPEEIHDRCRKDHAGNGTFQRVMKTIHMLKKYQIEYNILTVVTAESALRGKELYAYFKEHEFHFQQYIECLDPIGEITGAREYSLLPELYEQFLKDIFDVWYQDMKHGSYTYNRYFENLMMILAGNSPEGCHMRGVCGAQWVVEADGSVYPCDFYALDEWCLGNIREDSFEKMEKKRQELGFIQWSRRLPEECRRCRYVMLCRNGCRRSREPVTADSAQKNYFCVAYRGFFDYAYPRLIEVLYMLR